MNALASRQSSKKKIQLNLRNWLLQIYWHNKWFNFEFEIYFKMEILGLWCVILWTIITLSRVAFYHYCHRFGVEISINYITHFHFYRFMPLPKARAGRSMQTEGTSGWWCIILWPLLGVCWWSAGTLWLSKWPCFCWQESWSNWRLRLSMESKVLRWKANSK